jgi:hypothetical protein
MKFFAVSFLLNLKKFLMRRAFWCGLIILPIAVAAGGALLKSEAGLITITAGIYLNLESPFEAAIFENLANTTQNTGTIRFIPYNNKEALIKDVSLSRLECGYILNPNIQNAQRGSFIGTVTLITSPSTIAAPILNDIVATAILRASAEYITIDSIRGFFPESENIKDFVTWQFEEYNKSDIFMTPTFIDIAAQTGLESKPNEAAKTLQEITASRIFRGLIGLTIHILIIFAIPIFINEKQNHLQKALKIRGKSAVYGFSLLSASFTAMIIIGAAGLISANIFAQPLPAAALTEITALVMLCTICAALLTLIGRLFKTARAIQSFGLFIIIANIFFGGVILDLTELAPALSSIQKIFPLFWYTSF